MASSPSRRLKRAIGTGAISGAMLLGAVGIASAQPAPPPCSAAELAQVMSGVNAQTSNYLTNHPDVNNFFTGLKDQSSEQVQQQVQTYLDANPQIRSDLQAIRQPAVDLRNRCEQPLTVP